MGSILVVHWLNCPTVCEILETESVFPILADRCPTTEPSGSPRAYVFNTVMISVKLPSSELPNLKVILGIPNLQLVSELGLFHLSWEEIYSPTVSSLEHHLKVRGMARSTLRKPPRAKGLPLGRGKKKEEMITIRSTGKICVCLRLKKWTKLYCLAFLICILSGTVFNLILF